VDEQPVAELLPGLYREVLDVVAELEQIGRRREAERVRSDAVSAYSQAWNDAAAMRLRRLRDDAGRIAAAQRRSGAARPWQTAKRRSIEGRPA